MRYIRQIIQRGIYLPNFHRSFGRFLQKEAPMSQMEAFPYNKYYKICRLRKAVLITIENFWLQIVEKLLFSCGIGTCFWCKLH